MHTRMQGLETLKQREEQVKSQQSKGERQKPEEEESRLAEEVEGTYRQKVGRKVIQQSTPQSKPSALDTFNSIKKKFEGWCADVAEQHKTHSLGRHSRRKQLPSLPRTVSYMLYLAAIICFFRCQHPALFQALMIHWDFGKVSHSWTCAIKKRGDKPCCSFWSYDMENDRKFKQYRMNYVYFPSVLIHG